MLFADIARRKSNKRYSTSESTGKFEHNFVSFIFVSFYNLMPISLTKETDHHWRWLPCQGAG